MGTRLIGNGEWKDLLSRQQAYENNDDRLFQLEKEKTPFLFTSEQLWALCEITPSVKTRLAMIAHLGPRLVDPKAKANQFIQLFRYAEEKERVESILKMRTNVLAASLFKPSSLSTALSSERTDHSGDNQQSNQATKPVPSTTITSATTTAPFSIKGLVGARMKQQTGANSSPMKTNGSHEALDSKSLHEVSPTQQQQSFYKNTFGSPSSPSLEQAQAAQATSRSIQTLFLEVDTTVESSHVRLNKAIKSSAFHHSSVASSSSSLSSSEVATLSRISYLRKSPDPEVITTNTSSTNAPTATAGLSRGGSSTTGSHSKFTSKFVVTSSPEKGAAGSQHTFKSNSWMLLAEADDPCSVNTTNEGDFNDVDEQSHIKRPSVRELCVNYDRTTKQTSTTTDTASSCSSPAVSPTKSWDLWGTVMKTASFFQSASGRPVVMNHLTSTVAGQIGADLGYYRDLPIEGPVGVDIHGIQQFRYQELLRKNFVKDYDGIVYPAELERHCIDDDFVLMFGINKEAFALLPSWKKIQQKKSLLLF